MSATVLVVEVIDCFPPSGDRPFPWIVRLVRKGERYGLDNCLVHKEEDPLIEFYDARFKGEPGKFTEFGQFVARYRASTLCARPPENGLCLRGDMPAWAISGEALHSALVTLGWTAVSPTAVPQLGKPWEKYYAQT